MAEIQLDAESRSEFGKGAARRIRRDNKVPAVLYGHGSEPIHISLPGHATALALRQANALLNIVIDGGQGQLALPKQVQRDAVKGFLKHVDLLIVRRGEKVTVEVPLVLVGEAAPETTVNHDLMTLPLEVEATNIPQHIEVSIEGLEAGSQVTAADLTLPEGAVFHGDPETLIVGVNVAQELSLESEEEEGAEGEESEAEGDEGEESDEA